MQAFSDKLINITARHKEDMSRRWCRAVRSNPRTSSLRNLSEEECYDYALNYYIKLKDMYFDEKPYPEVQKYFNRYAEEFFKKGIPLAEAVYALIMLRRHMWLYADFQAPFLTGMDHHQAVETINRTIRIFDHGIYLVIEKYEALRATRQGA